MTRKPGLIATAVALAVMIAASIWTYGDLPERVATHFDAAGNPDGWSSRTAAVLIMPLITLGTALLLAFLPAIEPRKHNLQRSAKVYNAAWIGAMVVLTIGHLGILFNASGMDFPFLRLTIVAVGGLFVVIGNYLGKTRSNWFAGVRTPWTLSSEKSWHRTHRLCGRLFACLGLVVIVVGLLVPSVAAYVILAGSMGIAVWMTVYSYLVWRGDPDRSSTG